MTDPEKLHAPERSRDLRDPFNDEALNLAHRLANFLLSITADSRSIADLWPHAPDHVARENAARFIRFQQLARIFKSIAPRPTDPNLCP